MAVFLFVCLLWSSEQEHKNYNILKTLLFFVGFNRTKYLRFGCDRVNFHHSSFLGAVLWSCDEIKADNTLMV